jgi:hypothetical protein
VTPPKGGQHKGQVPEAEQESLHGPPNLPAPKVRADQEYREDTLHAACTCPGCPSCPAGLERGTIAACTSFCKFYPRLILPDNFFLQHCLVGLTECLAEEGTQTRHLHRLRLGHFFDCLPALSAVPYLLLPP